MRDGWRAAALGDLVEINPEKTPRWPDNHLIRYVDISSVSWGQPLPTDIPLQAFGSAPGRARRLIRADDVLVSTVRPNLRAMAVVPPELDTEVASTGFAVLRARPELALPAFVWACVSHEAFRDDMMSKATGSNYPAVRPPDVGAHQVFLPPLDEQRRIVDLIGTIDDAIEAAETVAFQLERTWWSLAHRLEANVADLDSVPLGEISDIHGGLTKNKKDAERADAMEAPYLRVANVLRRKIVLDDVATIIASRRRVEASQLQAGDLLMTEGGDRDKLGRGAVWRGEVEGCTHQNHVFRVRITREGFVPEFVSAWSNSFGMKWFDIHAAQTTGIASISKSTLSRFPVPRVPIENQLTWASMFDDVHQQEERMRAHADHLRDLRSNLLTVLLSGEHEIPESYDELIEVAAA